MCGIVAKSLNDGNKESIVSFIQSFEGKQVTIIMVGWQLVFQLVKKEYLIW